MICGVLVPVELTCATPHAEGRDGPEDQTKISDYVALSLKSRTQALAPCTTFASSSTISPNEYMSMNSSHVLA